MASDDVRKSPDIEVLDALRWLAELLAYRLEARAGGRTGEVASICELAGELSRQLDRPQPALLEPPPLPQNGWIPSLAHLCRLNSLECLILIAALAPTVDGRFAHAFGRFQGLERPERATVDLVGRLLAFTIPERIRMAGYVRAGSLIQRLGLLHLDWSAGGALPPHVQALQLPERVRAHLLDASEDPSESLLLLLKSRSPRLPLDNQPLDERVRAQLRSFVKAHLLQGEQQGLAPVLLIEGPWGAGQVEAAEGIAYELGLRVLEFDAGPALTSPEYGALLVALRRELVLQRAIVLIHAQLEEENQDLLQRRFLMMLEHELRDTQFPIVASGNLATLAVLRDLERPYMRIELRLPERKFQHQAIVNAMRIQGVSAESDAVLGLLNRYNLDLQSATEVVRAASALARSDRVEVKAVQAQELESAVELILRRHLGSLSQRLSARFDWEDLVLPDDVVIQLKTLRNLIEHRSLVFEEWGLGRKASGGRGIKALFSGPSGTGKTMAAEVIASDLRLPLYRVDLSSVVSKWVGETEKNLEKIFREAQGSQAILLFDEADALFGKRGSVENANDRHANLEVSFLLQRFEVHDGVVILTSNFPSVIDEAFSRRMHFLIDFPLPDEETRRILWQKLLIPSLPKTDDIDTAFLAQRFEISGANIKNVVMGAAFQAAAAGGKVGMREIALSMQWEYQKLGRSVSISDFGRFRIH